MPVCGRDWSRAAETLGRANQIPKLVPKLQMENPSAVTIGVNCTFSQAFKLSIMITANGAAYDEFGPAFSWMGNIIVLMTKLELEYDGDGDIIVGGAIAPGVIVRMTAADIHIDYKLRYCIGHRTESKCTSLW